ncbi:hypothetical protein ATCC90586_005456 [Pythium insidiosum]|nr:hypothetical protein ATCC90586_005456 [Pythium insidiosum]
MRIHLLSAAATLGALAHATQAEPSQVSGLNGWFPCGPSELDPAAAAAAAAEPGAAPVISPDLRELDFECGTIRAPLCHTGICQSDKKIDLFVKRVRPMQNATATKALWTLQGGPGFSSERLEGVMKTLYGMLEGTTNVYTVDHRGTGRSFFLNCRGAQAFTTGSPGITNIDVLEIPNCVKDVMFQIDNQTAAFSVTSAAKDVEFVISNNVSTESDVFVHGSSYGTYLAERVMHLAPPQVRGYILDGVVSEARPTFATFSSDRIPVGIFYASLCEKDPVCSSKYVYGVKEHGDLHSAWVATFKKLDDAKPGAKTCSELVSGSKPSSKPSMLLRGIISSLPVMAMTVDSPMPPREVIPALFKLLDRCEKDDVAAIRALFQLQPNDTLQIYWDRLISSGDSPPGAFNEITGMSPLLSYVIKASEMWTFPSVSQDIVNKKMAEGVFAIDSTDEYAWFCMLNGDWKDPSCTSLIEFGKRMKPPRDFTNIPLAPFTYKRDDYFLKVAKVPRNASVMVMNGKLDFQTVHTDALEQFEKMEGSAKLLVEFPYGGHCPGKYDPLCGTTVLASYVRTGGSVNATNFSCATSMPAPNFDAEAFIKARLSRGGPGGLTNGSNVTNSDKKIDLFVKRVRPVQNATATKALWMLEGGPGFSSSGLEGAMKGLYGMLEGTTNVYTVDHRGTGRSFFLNCRAAQAFTTGSPGSSNIDFLEFPNCVKDVMFQIDNQTAAFSVTSAAKDVEAVISSVSTESEVFLYGASYGTYLTERVMHLAPSQVRGYILDGVASEANPSFAKFSSNRIPVGKYYASLCEKDPLCSSKYVYGVKEHGDLHSAWVATFKKLDDAKPGAKTCSEFVSGSTPSSKPSMLLRAIISTLPATPLPGNIPVPPRQVLPALMKLLDRCEKDDMATIRSFFQLQSNDTLKSGWDRLTGSMASPVAPLNEITNNSPLLAYLIKASEMWTFPSVSLDEENKKMAEGVFAIDSTDDYAYFCMLNGDWKDPSCPSLIQYGKQQEPSRDFSNIPLAPFTYKRDNYFQKVAKIPRNASVMVMNGKLDFQTVFAGAAEQYEKMEGSAKLLVEFPFEGHCPGLNGECGLTIIASFVRAGGSVNATNVSCVASLPPPSFDMDTYMKSRVSPEDANNTKNGSSVTNVRSAALGALTGQSGLVGALVTALAIVFMM